MKRKRFDKRDWPRVRRGVQSVLQLPQGVIVDYLALEVARPLTVPFQGRELTILDDGYRWVHFAPHGAHHALTLQLRPDGHPEQLYVDVTLGGGTDDDGLPWAWDLYLDVIGTLDERWQVQATEIIDLGDLNAAVQAGLVTAEQDAFALEEAARVQAALFAGTFTPLDVLRRYLEDPYT